MELDSRSLDLERFFDREKNEGVRFKKIRASSMSTRVSANRSIFVEVTMVMAQKRCRCRPLHYCVQTCTARLIQPLREAT